MQKTLILMQKIKKKFFLKRERETRQREEEGRVCVCVGGGVKLKLSSTSWNGGNRNDLRWESVGGGQEQGWEGRKEEEQNWGG